MNHPLQEKLQTIIPNIEKLDQHIAIPMNWLEQLIDMNARLIQQNDKLLNQNDSLLESYHISKTIVKGKA